MSEGVHVEHCCVRHGCKYGNGHTRNQMLQSIGADPEGPCPVESGQLKQAHPCEQCLDANKDHAENVPADVLLAATKLERIMDEDLTASGVMWRSRLDGEDVRAVIMWVIHGPGLPPLASKEVRGG